MSALNTLNNAQTSADLSQFLSQLRQDIPLVQHLGIKNLSWQADKTLSCALNFAPLVNDKGTGFGGGLAALATLLGWCWVSLERQALGQPGPVVVKTSNNAFSAPITQDFQMHCRLSQPEQLATFQQQLLAKKRGYLNLEVWVEENAKQAFSYQGVYVAL